MIVLEWIAASVITAQLWFNDAYDNLSGIPIIGEFLAQPFHWLAEICRVVSRYIYEFSEQLDNLFDSIVSAAGSVINYIYEAAVTVYETLPISEIFDAIRSFVNPIIADIWDAINPLATYISNIAADVSRGFAAIPALLFGGLEKLVLTFFDGFELISGNIFSLITEAYTNTRDLVENWVDYVWGALKSSGEFLKDLHENFTERVGEAVFGPLMTAEDWLNSKMSDIMSYMMNHISEFIDDILTAIFDTLEAHMEKWSDRIMKVIEAFFEHV